MLCCLDCCADIHSVRANRFGRRKQQDSAVNFNIGIFDKDENGKSRDIPQERDEPDELALSPSLAREDGVVAEDEAEHVGRMRSEPRAISERKRLNSPVSVEQWVDEMDPPPKIGTPESADTSFDMDGTFESVEREKHLETTQVRPGIDMPIFDRRRNRRR